MVNKLGFVQALGVTLYCVLIGLLIWGGNEIFGNPPNYLGPVAFLLLFSTSVLVCGLLVFYHPYRLFFEGKKKEAADLVLFTTAWLSLFFLAFLLLTVFLRSTS